MIVDMWVCFDRGSQKTEKAHVGAGKEYEKSPKQTEEVHTGEPWASLHRVARAKRQRQLMQT